MGMFSTGYLGWSSKVPFCRVKQIDNLYVDEHLIWIFVKALAIVRPSHYFRQIRHFR